MDFVHLGICGYKHELDSEKYFFSKNNIFFNKLFSIFPPQFFQTLEENEKKIFFQKLQEHEEKIYKK